MTDTALSQPEKELKGRHVLLWMLCFFGVVFAVNGVFLYHAITSFPGEDVKKSYVQGINYNQTLEARVMQAELGWRAEIGIEGDTLILHLEDRSGNALSGYPVLGELRRITTRQADQVLIFEPDLNGNYQAPIAQLAKGKWQARIHILDHAAEQTIFTAHKTLIVR